MSRVEELLKQKEQIEAELEEAKKEERAAAIEEAKRLCKTFEITPTELRGALKMRKRKAKAAKD